MSEPIAVAIRGRPQVPAWAHSSIPGLLLTCGIAGAAYALRLIPVLTTPLIFGWH